MKTMRNRLLLTVALVLVGTLASADYRQDTTSGGVTTFKSSTDGSTPPVHIPVMSVDPTMPSSVTTLHSSSGNVANASAVATLAGAASVTTSICGFQVTAGGATAAAVVTGTITGTIGGTLSFTYGSQTGAGIPTAPLVVQFNPCLPASAVNTSIVLTLPALGAGNTNATVSAWGVRK